MAKELKALTAIVSVGMLVYITSLGGVSRAEIGSAKGQEESEGATISLEASVVRVAAEALEEKAGGSDFLALGSIPAETVLNRVGTEGVEAVGGVRLLVANGAVGEISAEDEATEVEKNAERQAGGTEKRSSSVLLKAEAQVRGAGKIAVKFSFRQVVSEKASSGSGEGEREQEIVHVFEASSQVGLEAGRPLVVGARRSGDVVMFLILRADI